MAPVLPPPPPGPQAHRAPEEPSGIPGQRPRVVGLPRAGGRWQIGVGPGAVLVHSQELPVLRAESAEGPAALLGAGLAAPAVGATAGRCPVIGSGRLATRIRAALGDVDPATDDGEGLLVLVQHHVVPPETALRVVQRDGPALPVVVQARRVVIGPVSGLGGPCLHCLDLRRRDLDGDWPEVAHTWGHPAVQSEPVPLSPALEDAAAGLAIVVAASLLCGPALPEGVAHEVGPDPPHLVTRTWTRHHACRWHRQA